MAWEAQQIISHYDGEVWAVVDKESETIIATCGAGTQAKETAAYIAHLKARWDNMGGKK